MTRHADSAVGLFPGQGAYRRGALRDEWRAGEPVVVEVYTAVDRAAEALLGKSLTDVVFADEAPTGETLFRQHPDLMQLVVFAQSVATFRLLTANGATFSCLAGHSMGEIAALVCAGAYSVSDGAELLCERIRVLRDFDDSEGRMIALGTSAARVTAMLELLGEPDSVVAVQNGPHQTVVSGRSDSLRSVALVASAMKITSTALRSPHPFHNPVLHRAQDELRARLARFTAAPLDVPVYSPIFQRFYRDGEDFSALLARHLVAPLDFGGAVRRLWSAGESIFVEIGPGSGLAGIVLASAPSATVVEPFRHDGDGDALAANARFLASAPVGAASRAPAFPAGWEQRSSEPRRADTPRPPAASATVTGAADATPPQDVSTGLSAPAVTEPAVATERDGATPPGREEVFDQIRALYADALGYPEEVLTSEAMFEAELGIDSVQQTELLQQVSRLFRLPDGGERAAPSRFTTLGQVVSHVIDRRVGAGAA